MEFNFIRGQIEALRLFVIGIFAAGLCLATAESAVSTGTNAAAGGSSGSD